MYKVCTQNKYTLTHKICREKSIIKKVANSLEITNAQIHDRTSRTLHFSMAK